MSIPGVLQSTYFLILVASIISRGTKVQARIIQSATETVTIHPATCQGTGWTQWMNVDTPSVGPEKGDFETLHQLRLQHSFCENPIEIECREVHSLVSYDEIPGQKASCDLYNGFECHNWNQVTCLDYEVRFYCPCATKVQSIPTTTAVTTTTIRPANCQESGWTPWIDVDTPSVGSKKEVLESIHQLRTKRLFCENPIEIQLKEVYSLVCYDAPPKRSSICDPLDGYECNDRDKLAGICLDYEFRFYCLCGEF
ncbi:mucin-5AC-like [Glandiceps talaboti]